MCFLNRLDEVVRTTPDKMAIIDLGTGSATRDTVPDTTYILTYGQLYGLAERVASRLIDLGIKSGEPVAYQLPSGWEFIALTLGIWLAGCVACPLLPTLREREVRFILESSRSRLLVVPEVFRGHSYVPMATHVIRSLAQEVELFVVRPVNRNPELSALGGLMAKQVDATSLALRRPQPDALAQLLYTSGTTGEPKGVVHTFATLSYALDSHRRTLGLTDQDTVWIPSPLAHQTGFLYGMMVSHYNGSTGIYQSTWSVDTATLAITQHGAKFVQAAMPFLADLTRCPEPPVGLRIFVATGAAIPRQLADEARRALQCAVLGAWGSTETCLVTVGRPTDPVHKQWGADGSVIEGMAVRIVDDHGNELPAGIEGGFQVKTPAMFTTYLNHPEWYRGAVTEDRFFDTGDLAVLDAEGYIRLTGRKKDVINRGGEKIPVAEIEELLYRHPHLRDAAIVAMADQRLGERACAFIVMKPGQSPLTLQEMQAFLQSEGVAKIYWPERVEPVESLPRTPSGKVQKFLLRQQIADKLAAEMAVSVQEG